MEKPWFQNRKCLDIGCNEGMVTLGLVTRFGTDSMLGVDIDQVLINKASRSGVPASQSYILPCSCRPFQPAVRFGVGRLSFSSKKALWEDLKACECFIPGT